MARSAWKAAALCSLSILSGHFCRWSAGPEGAIRVHSRRPPRHLGEMAIAAGLREGCGPRRGSNPG